MNFSKLYQTNSEKLHQRLGNLNTSKLYIDSFGFELRFELFWVQFLPNYITVMERCTQTITSPTATGEIARKYMEYDVDNIIF